MIAQYHDLVGKWVQLITDDGEHYRVGEVTRRVGDYHWLVRVRPFGDMPTSSEVISIDMLEGQTVFETEADMDAWLAWAEREDEDRGPRVVSMTPRKGRDK